MFDREGDDGKFVSVTVKATDQGEPSLEGVCSFTGNDTLFLLSISLKKIFNSILTLLFVLFSVEITDVNDNVRYF